MSAHRISRYTTKLTGDVHSCLALVAESLNLKFCDDRNCRHVGRKHLIFGAASALIGWADRLGQRGLLLAS